MQAGVATSAEVVTNEVEGASGVMQRDADDAHGPPSTAAKTPTITLPKQRDAARVSLPPSDSDRPTQFGLIHVSGVQGQLQDEDKLKEVFSAFGTVQAIHMRQERVSKALWALVTFVDVPQAQAAIDAALDLNTEHPGLVSCAASC